MLCVCTRMRVCVCVCAVYKNLYIYFYAQQDHRSQWLLKVSKKVCVEHIWPDLS